MPAAKRGVAATLIALITFANYRSVPLAAGVQNISTSAKALALLGLRRVHLCARQGIRRRAGGADHFNVSSWGAFGVALIGVLFTYEGAAAFCALSGEVRDPRATCPRVLLFGVALVTALYLLVNAAYLYVLPIEAHEESSSLVAADAMARVAGHSAASVISALVMLSTFGAVAATAIADPRVFYSMAQEGLFFRALGKVHARSETPHVAIVVAGVIAIVCVSSRNVRAADLRFHPRPMAVLCAGRALGSSCCGSGNRSCRAPTGPWGYPVVPLIFVAAAILVLANSFIEQRTISLINVAISLSGIPVYYIWHALNRRANLIALTSP